MRNESSAVRRILGLFRIIAICGLTALCGGLGILIIYEILPWTTPKIVLRSVLVPRTSTLHFGIFRCEWYALGGTLFIQEPFLVRKSVNPTREFRLGNLRAKRDTFTPDIWQKPYKEPIRGRLPVDQTPLAEQVETKRLANLKLARITLQIPTLPLCLLLGLYPAIVFVFARKRGRERARRQGLCIKCGYNLTGNITGLCPECGQKILK